MAKEFPYKIAKTEGVCHHTQNPLEPGEEFVALIRLQKNEILREDYSLAAWDELDANPETQLDTGPDVLGVWHTHVPRKEEKKKLLVDDAVLVEFFERLEGQNEPERLQFRFVLALILMRKRKLAYEGSEKQNEQDVWRMRMRGTKNIHHVIDPHLDEDKIAAVSESLSTIMEGDF